MFKVHPCYIGCFKISIFLEMKNTPCINVPCFVSPVILEWTYGLLSHWTILNKMLSILYNIWILVFNALWYNPEIKLLDMINLCLIFSVYYSCCPILHFYQHCSTYRTANATHRLQISSRILWVAFAVSNTFWHTNVFNLIKCNLPTFCLAVYLFWGLFVCLGFVWCHIQNISLNPISWSPSLVFSFKFYSFSSMFVSLIHLCSFLHMV